jgi:ABC-type lipoprotein release transport system permease subunit
LNAPPETMTIATLIQRNLSHYWRTNLAVFAGVAITVAVLAGALLVGDSVRASLRDLALGRLGNTTHVIAAEEFFPQSLAERIARQGSAPATLSAVPLVTLEAVVTHEASSRRASAVQVFGVDQRFWDFHRVPRTKAPTGREVLLSPTLARELGAQSGDSILVRVHKPSDIPVESLHGRKDELGRALRLTLREALPGDSLGEFSLRPQQAEVRAVFLPLSRLQQDLKLDAQVNAILVSFPTDPKDANAVQQALRSAFTLADFGLRVKQLDPRGEIAIASDRILIGDSIASAAQAAAADLQWSVTPVFTYLATAIRAGTREIPYSLVSALPLSYVADQAPRELASGLPPLLLNRWAAADLRARLGHKITLEYLVWEEGLGLVARSADFRFAGIVPSERAAADRDLAPQFPGISESPDMADWDPPFPVNLKRIRPKDEDYWHKYRTTPKAFLRIEDGQRLWNSRFGKLTALRLRPPIGDSPAPAQAQFETRLREKLDPLRAGFAVLAMRAEGELASRGAVNFSEYFVYFSFFLVVAAVLLTGLFFRLGIEQRLREIGLLRAVGFSPAWIGRLFVTEGAVLALLGSLAGLAGAAGYAALMMYGLRTWWVEAVGTTLLRLHVEPSSLFLGGLGGMAAVLLAVLLTLRGLRAASPLQLLGGSHETEAASPTPAARAPRFAGLGAALLGLALLLGAAAGRLNQVAAFFASGTLLLVALVCFEWVWLVRRRRGLTGRPGLAAVSRLGFRNATWRPGRSLLCIALIAAATFVIVAVGAFRRTGAESPLAVKSGTGGYALLAESIVPLPYDPNTPSGWRELGLSESGEAALNGVELTALRLRPGEDASCLNLYQPRNPRILGAPSSFLRAGRFAFQSSLASTLAEQRNPWLQLESDASDGFIPAIADANTMTYILHLQLGDEFVLNPTGERPVRLRLVAALNDSILQSELIIAEKHFLRLFPALQGYRVFLIQTPPGSAGGVAAALESRLSDFGFDAVSAAERLATFHRVENTYLATFQTLGGLGLLLGTVGLAAVLLRNVLERRRELALLRAVGYRPADLGVLVLAENLLLLVGGLFSGVLSALLAIAPALAGRGGTLPGGSLVLLLLGVLMAGLVASLAAVGVVVRAPLLETLRAE